MHCTAHSLVQGTGRLTARWTSGSFLIDKQTALCRHNCSTDSIASSSHHPLPPSFPLAFCTMQNLKLNHCTGITVNGVKRLLDVPSLAQLFLLGCRNVRCAEFNKLQFPPSSFVCI